MKPMLDPSFWSDPEIEAAAPEVKLAALWLITNSRTSLLGICGASPLRFQFETGLAPQVLEDTIKALPRAFKRFGGLVFVVNYIRHQFGIGEKLTKNNFFVGLKSLFLAVKDAELSAFILEEYPEFATALSVIHRDQRDHTVASGLRLQIIARDENVCLYTQEKLSEEDLEADHIVPRSKGGKTVPENLMAASARMNTLKNNKDLEVFCEEQGFDFIRISETIKVRASKPLPGLSKPKYSKGKKGEGKELPEIPEQLAAVDGFAEAWPQFIQHRREIKKPLTPLAAVGIFNSLCERPAESVFALKTAIRRGWQGIEWAWIDKEKPGGNGSPPARPSPALPSAKDIYGPNA